MTKTEATNAYNQIKNELVISSTNSSKLHLVFNPRLKRAFGRCNVSGKIELSSHFVANGSEADILDTLRHEIAHFVAYCRTGRLAHCRTWKNIFLSMGGSGEVTSTKKGLPERRWGIACSGCGDILGLRHKRAMKLYGKFGTCCRKPLVWADMHAISKAVETVIGKR